MLYAVGDIHGRFDLLVDIHRKITEHAKQYDEVHTVIFLGDYIDRGPQSKEVLDFLRYDPFKGFKHVYLRGNHEDMFVKSLYGDPDEVIFHNNHYNIVYARNVFLDNGGTTTLKSFGIDNPDVILFNKNKVQDIFIPYTRFFSQLKPYYIANGYLFVHAGIEPGISLENQNQNELYWIRGPFLHSDANHGYLVIHGHTVTTSQGTGTLPDVRPNRINLDTKAYSTGVLTAVCLDEAHEAEPVFLSTNNANPFKALAI